MTEGGTILGYVFGMLGGALLFILGIALIFYWVIGTWMNSIPVLGAGLACIFAGVYVAWYFWR